MNDTSVDSSATPIEMRGVAMGASQEPDYLVLKDVDWSVAPGEFWVLGAPHHSGKTEFLMTTGGLMPPVGGSYKFYGKETRVFDESRLADRLRMGFVFEQSQLFHYLTVAENVAFPLLERTRLVDSTIDEVVLLKLAQVGLAHFASFYPSQLSGGMLKRASVAALEESATTDLCSATHPVTPSPTFMRKFPSAAA